jgi:NDP-sugar pyrophosphorylase family protein
MLDFHVDRGVEATFGVRPHQVDIPYGVADVAGERLVGLREKPSERMMINAGIYVLSPHLIDSIPRGQDYPITDLFQQLIAANAPVGAYLIHDDWIDVGQPTELQRARGGL